MATDVKKEIELDIGHVLFIDIVGYSKLLITEQSEQMEKLREIVRATEQFRSAEAQGKLLRLPTGDGGALVFRTNPEAPVLCALEIGKELKKHPELRVRMGIHSGPVNEITDLNQQANIAGAGINMAQRVTDCGDAGHILLSRHVAEDLEQYPRWRSQLHDLGECEVKHGVRVGVANLYSDEVGNPRLPSKLQAIKKHRAHVRWAQVVVGLLVLAAIIGGAFFFLRRPERLASTVVEKSIAVLPFENLSEEKQNEYFADGVQDEILTDLAKISDLKVISRTSVMQYKSGVARNLREIGQQLGVAHLLEGSVQRAANKVRVNAQLIDARTDAHLWAQTYDRDLADVFVIQSEIAKAIADQLQAKLSPDEKAAIEKPPTTDVIAFDLYTRARTLLLSAPFSADINQRFLEAVDLLNQAVARDPSFFLAYCQLVYAHNQLYIEGVNEHTPARRALAEAAMENAVRLRPNAGEAHLARAETLYQGYLDYDGALVELEKARITLPNDSRVLELHGRILRRRGQREEALRDFQRALELDPRNFFLMLHIMSTNYVLKRYAEAMAYLDRALAINPNDVGLQATRPQLELDWKADTRPLHKFIDSIREKNSAALSDVADLWFLCALAERDAAAAEHAVAALGHNPITEDQVSFSPSFCEGLIARMTNDETKARAALTAAREAQVKAVEAQPDFGPALCVLGVIDAGLGRKDEALREGRHAIELMPLEKDFVNGMHMIEYLAVIAAWVGEKELAYEELEKAIRLSGYGIQSYGELKLTPWWDPLRGDPRFEKIVQSLAPKQ